MITEHRRGSVLGVGRGITRPCKAKPTPACMLERNTTLCERASANEPAQNPPGVWSVTSQRSPSMTSIWRSRERGWSPRRGNRGAPGVPIRDHRDPFVRVERERPRTRLAGAELVAMESKVTSVLGHPPAVHLDLADQLLMIDASPLRQMAGRDREIVRVSSVKDRREHKST